MSGSQLLHDMAKVLAHLVDEPQPLGIVRTAYQDALKVLDRYDAENVDLVTVPEVRE